MAGKTVDDWDEWMVESLVVQRVPTRAASLVAYLAGATAEQKVDELAVV